MHSPIAPSSAECWVNCRGSVALCQRVPVPPETDESRDGTASHWVGSEALEGRPVSIGAVAPNMVTTTEEMHEGAQLWINTCSRAVEESGLQGHLQVESRLSMAQVHEQCFGTTDTWLWDERRRTLRIWDYKYGHRFVDIVGNWQLLLYALGALDLLGLDDRNWSDVWVELTIIQPRSFRSEGPVRTWRLSARDLPRYRDSLVAAAREALSPGAQLNVGPWCRDCTARHGCPALNRAVHEIQDMVSEQYLDLLSPTDLGKHLEALERAEGLLKSRISGIRGHIEAEVRSGKGVPGWLLERVEGRLKWTAPLESIRLIGALYGATVTKEEPITPTQAIKAGIPAEVVNNHAKRGQSLELARNDKLITRIAQELGHHGK